MEEKILTTLLQMNDKFEKRFNEMDQKFEKKFAEMDQKFQKKLDMVKEEILDSQFKFEHEYGAKIDAIFEIVSIQHDRNFESLVETENLKKRIERNEVAILAQEHRISKLEEKTV